MPDFNKIAKKWQKKWEEKKVFEVKEYPKIKKYYVLEMYPYPSASGLHMGHSRNYAIGDCFARYKRMQGFNVLYPMGYDSFGLPAENAAIEAKSHPKIFTEKAIKNFIKQQKELGLSYDWSRVIACHTPEYYRWDQWIFLQLYKKGLAYKKKSFVNWCPKCKTVLANEQVHDGKCWRHTEQDVQVKELDQWFFKITKYCEKLLKGLEKLKEWPEDVKIMQRNWIGRSEGTLIKFKIKDTNEVIPIFTTRADTIYGVTFMVFAPENPLVRKWVSGTKYEKDFEKFLKEVQKESFIERTDMETEKKGMFIGKYAINPITNEEVPVYIGNFVIYEYGAGAVMAVPAHDQRDFEFAKKFKIQIKVVISPEMFDLKPETMTRAYLEDGKLVNSEEFNGMNNRDAIFEISKKLEKLGRGGRTVNYKLRDWLISRQRYWGCPIPIIYCDKCGIVPVPEKDLPVLLPEDVKFGGSGNPVLTSKVFLNVKCPKCKGNAKRETDTMDTFVDSSWYFMRYTDPKNSKEIFDKKKVNYWLPIDQYIGGKEHATGHLIYFRFLTKFFHDLGLVKFDEPALRLFNQGMLHKNGVVMSKSKGNVVLPEEVSKKYGIDTGRLFLLFVSSPSKDMEWSDEGVEGSFRFLNKVYRLITEKKITDKVDNKQISKMHRTIKEVTESFENFKFNNGVISLMELTNYLSNFDEINRKVAENLVIMLSPFVPHLSEELWEKLGQKGFVSLVKWPKYDIKKIDVKVEALDELIEKTVYDIKGVLDLIKIEKPKKITIITAANWKYNFVKSLKKEIDKTRDLNVLIKALMKETILKKYGKEISKLVPMFLKDASKLPKTVLDQKTEFESLENSKAVFEKEFKAEVEVIKAEDSKHEKASKALPNKPAIVVE